ncbi:hypothetical protein GW17_00008102 [Ensete ventricosum]|nr:hypothetical protein GW17_00008102 [Ensete ventricosum]
MPWQGRRRRSLTSMVSTESYKNGVDVVDGASFMEFGVTRLTNPPQCNATAGRHNPRKTPALHRFQTLLTPMALPGRKKINASPCGMATMATRTKHKGVDRYGRIFLTVLRNIPPPSGPSDGINENKN